MYSGTIGETDTEVTLIVNDIYLGTCIYFARYLATLPGDMQEGMNMPICRIIVLM